MSLGSLSERAHSSPGPSGAFAFSGLAATLDSLTVDDTTSPYVAWSRTYPEMYTITHEWTVENFIDLDEEVQVSFKVTIEGNEELRFKVSMKPKYGENKDNVSLYVHNLNKKDLKYSLVFNMLNSSKERKLSRRADTRTHAPNESWGFSKFCQRSDIVDNPTMLPDGSLTILCEIRCFRHVASRSDYQKLRKTYELDSSGNLSHDLLDALSTMDHYDVELCCHDEVFRCHKFMLAARSDVFRAMFTHDMQESKDNRVEILDASPEVVRQFLKFVYTDSFEDKSYTTVAQLLSLAEKYNVKRLSVLCAQLLLEGISEENVSEVAVIGQIYDIALLKNKAVEYISRNPEQVLKTTGWKKLLKDAPDICSAVIRRLSRSDVEVKPMSKANIPTNF